MQGEGFRGLGLHVQEWDMVVLTIVGPRNP